MLQKICIFDVSNNNKKMATEITRIQHRGTEIVKIENELPLNNGIFEDDYIYCSCGFLKALNSGLLPTQEFTTEWHHFFIKEGNDFICNKINFK